MRRLLLALSVLLTWASSPAAADFCPTPADHAAYALADLQRVPPVSRSYTRYLSIGHLPPKDRPTAVRVLSYQLNGLSRSPDLTPPVAVTLAPQAAALFPLTLTPFSTPYVLTNIAPARDCVLWDAVLLRLDVRDYQDFRGRGFPAKIWEELRFFDPYYHVQVREDWPGGVDPKDGQFYKKGKYRTAAQAPWLDRKTMLQLVTATGSQAPILRADWFFDQTAVQFGRDGRGYYDFLALGKKEKDFQDLVGADGKKTEEQFAEFGAVIKRSALVAVNNRHLRRQPAFNRDPRGGNYWYTIDFKTSTDKQNAVRILNGLNTKGDASEQIGRLSNGLGAFWLQDGKGNRQDVPPPDIAVNMLAGHPFQIQVHPPLTCIRCHETIIIPPKDYIRRLARASYTAQSPDYEEAKRLRALYASDLEEAVKLDIAAYDVVTYKACGLNSKQLARAYGKFWDAYHEEDVLVDVAERELGLSAGRIVDALQKQFAAIKQNDPVLAAWLIGDGVRREHFEEAVPLIYLLVAKYP